MNRSEIDKWFADLGVSDFSGEATFDSENGLQVEFVLSEDGRELLITNVIGLLSIRTDVDVYRLVLRTNYLGLETGGGCIALAEDDETLLLWRVVPLSAVDPDALTNIISSLLDAAEECRRHIFDESTEAKVGQSAISPAPMSLA